MHRGEASFAERFAALAEGDLDHDSALPGWSRRDVVGHVLRNATGITNLLLWATTGVERPMYDDNLDRSTAFRRLGSRPTPVLSSDLHGRAVQLANLVEAAPESTWSRTVRTAKGREVLAARLPWLRARETWIHAIDLQVGIGFHDLPEEMLRELFDDATCTFAHSETCPAMIVGCPGIADPRRIGDGEARPLIVGGDLPVVVAWLCGRGDGASLHVDGRLDLPPPVPPWP